MSMAVRTEAAGGCLIVSADGYLRPADAGALCQGVLQALAESPQVVVCDLGEVVDMGERGATAFLLLADLCPAWPETPVLMVGVEGSLRDTFEATRVAERFALFRTRQEALAEPRPTAEVVTGRLRLQPTRDAPRRARAFVARHCPPDAGQTVEQYERVIVGELVSNAVRHAGTALEVRTAVSPRAMRVSVRDEASAWPEPVPAVHPGWEWDEHGRGLALVDALSDRWGVLPTADGGKLVWSQLQLGRRPRG
jgi:hypothetical protein